MSAIGRRTTWSRCRLRRSWASRGRSGGSRTGPGWGKICWYVCRHITSYWFMFLYSWLHSFIFGFGSGLGIKVQELCPSPSDKESASRGRSGGSRIKPGWDKPAGLLCWFFLIFALVWALRFGNLVLALQTRRVLLVSDLEGV
jgi:hypothetical protein